MNNNLNQPLNNNKNKFIENSKNNKPLGSATYSKNKKLLDKMLRDYQSFCKKYFGESTPIGSMTEERMNKLLEDEENKINKNKSNNNSNNNNQQFFDIFGDNNDTEFDFEKENLINFIPDDLNFSNNDRLGNHKNTKNDYNRRNKNLFKEEKEEEKKSKDKIEEEDEKKDIKNDKKKEEKVKDVNEEDNMNKSEEGYDDFENEDDVEEVKNQKARIIQRVFKSRKDKNKERIYFGYDKTNNYIIWIFIDKFDSNGKVKNIEIKSYSINEKNNLSFKKDIKDLLEVDSISKEEIKKNMNKIIDKFDKIVKNKEDDIKSNELDQKNNNNNMNKENNDEEKVVDDDGEEYTF